MEDRMDFTTQLSHQLKIEVDFTKPLPEKMVHLFHLLIKGNTNQNTNCIFHYVVNDWNYFVDFKGYSKKIKVTKYDYKERDKLNNMIAEYKSNYQYYIELDFDEGYSYNIGYQLMTYETNDELRFRIVPFGILCEEKMFLKMGETAYYFIYCKKTKHVKIQYDHWYNIESAENEFENLIFEEENKTDFINMEEMDLDSDYELNISQIELLYNIIKKYEPNLYCEPIPNIIEALFKIKKHIQYPIFSNQEVLHHIKQFEKVTPEELIQLGYHPEYYDIKNCFGIDSFINEPIRLEDIKVIKKWKIITKNHLIEPIIEYYHEINEIEFELNDIKLFLELFSQIKEDPRDIIKYVLRGVAAEHLDLHTVLRNTKDLYKKGFIKSWKGRYTQKLVQKNNMRNYIRLDKEILDAIEEKPTLDNLYKQLFSA